MYYDEKVSKDLSLKNAYLKGDKTNLSGNVFLDKPLNRLA